MSRLRRFGVCVAQSVGLLAVALAAVGIGLSTPQGHAVVGEGARQGLQAILAPGYTTSRPTISWDSTGRLRLESVVLTGPDGTELVHVDRLDTLLDLSGWRDRRVVLDGARLGGVDVTLDLDGEGILDIVRAFGGPGEADPDAKPWGGLPIDLVVQDLHLQDGAYRMRRRSADGALSPFLDIGAISAFGDVELPRGLPEVRVTGALVQGHLLRPGPLPVSVQGDVTWTGKGLILRGVSVDSLNNHLGLDGTIDDIAGEGLTDLQIDARTLDLPSLDALTHAGLAGRFVGHVDGKGPLSSLLLTADLRGTDGTPGRITLGEGSAVCLGRPTTTPDACGGPAGDDKELRWAAKLGMEHVQLESILPVVRGPLRLEGLLDARGHGTSWPDGVFVDAAHYDADNLDVYGVPVRHIDGDIRLDHGVLRLGDLHATGVAGNVGGDGTVDLQRGVVELDIAGPLDLAMLRDMGIEDLSGSGHYTGHVSVNWKVPGVPVDAWGELWAQNLHYTDGVMIEDAHARWKVHVQDAITDVDAIVDARRLHPWGAFAATADVPDLHVRVDDTIRVTGTAAVPELLYTELVRTTDVRAPFVFTRPRRGGVAVVTAEAQVGLTTLRDLPATGGVIGVNLVDKALKLQVDLDYEGDAYLIAHDVQIDLNRLAILAPAVQFQPTGRQDWRSTRPLRLRITDAGIADADLAIYSTLGALELTGTIGTTGTIGGDLRVKEFDLSSLAELAPDLASDLYGQLDLIARFDGDARHPHIVVDHVRAEDLYIAETARYAELRGKAELIPGRPADSLTLDVITGVAGSPLLQLRGTIPVRGDLAAPGLSDAGDVDARLVLFGGGLDRFNKLLPGVNLPEGEISALVHATGPMRDPDIDLHGVASIEMEGVPDDARVELELLRREGLLTTHVDAYQGLHAVARADGTAETKIDQVMRWLVGTGPKPDLASPELFASNLDVQLALTDLSIPTLQAIAGTDFDASGQITGTMNIQGSPVAPELRSDIVFRGKAAGADLLADLQLGTPSDIASHDASCKVQVTDGYAVLARLKAPEGPADAPAADPWVRLCGAVPLRIRTQQELTSWTSGTLDLGVDGAGIPLQLLGLIDPGLVVESSSRFGRATSSDASDNDRLLVSGVIGGKLDEPLPRLSFGVYGANIGYRPLGLSLRDLNLGGSLAPDPARPEQLLLELSSLDATTAPSGVSFQGLNIGAASQLHAEGGLVMDEWTLGALRGNVELNNAWVLGTDDTQLRATGDLALSGVFPDLKVVGDLSVDQGFFSLDAASLLETRDQRIDPAILIHRAAGSVRTDVAPEHGALDTLDIHVGVDLGRNTRTHIVMPLLDDLGAIGAQVTRADIEARTGGQVDVRINRGVPAIQGALVLQEGELKLLRADFELNEDSTITFLGADYANPRLDIHGVMSVTGGTVELGVTGTAAEPKAEFTSEAFGKDGALFTVFTGQAPDDLSSQQASAAYQALTDLLVNSVLGGLNLGTVSVDSDGTIRIGLPVYRTVYVESMFKPVPQLNQNRVTVVAEWSMLQNLLLTAAYGDRRIWGTFFWEKKF